MIRTGGFRDNIFQHTDLNSSHTNLSYFKFSQIDLKLHLCFVYSIQKINP